MHLTLIRMSYALECHTVFPFVFATSILKFIFPNNFNNIQKITKF